MDIYFYIINYLNILICIHYEVTERDREGGEGGANKKQMYIYTDYQSRLLKNRLKIFEDSICHKNVCLNILYYVIWI